MPLAALVLQASASPDGSLTRWRAEHYRVRGVVDEARAAAMLRVLAGLRNSLEAAEARPADPLCHVTTTFPSQRHDVPPLPAGSKLDAVQPGETRSPVSIFLTITVSAGITIVILTACLCAWSRGVAAGARRGAERAAGTRREQG